MKGLLHFKAFRTRQRNPSVFTLAELAAHVSPVIMLSSPSKYKALRGAKNRKNIFDWLVLVKNSWLHFLTTKITGSREFGWHFDIRTRFIYTHSEAHVPPSSFHMHSQRRPMKPISTDSDFFFVFQWNLTCRNLEIGLM